MISQAISPKWWRWLWLSALIVLIDQASKLTISHFLMPYQVIPVTSFFNWVLVYNTGAAFSFLADAGGWQRYFFVALAIAVSGLILFWLRQKAEEKLLAVSLSLILGGACGNLWDRLWYGKVVDFLDFYWRHYHWPAFNVADSAITIGALLLFWDSFRRPS